MSEEAKVTGAEVRVRKLVGAFNPDHVVELTVGEGWDNVGEELLTLPQVCELICLLAQCLPPEVNPPMKTIWLDRAAAPFTPSPEDE